jgi:prophage regulatory protein
MRRRWPTSRCSPRTTSRWIRRRRDPAPGSLWWTPQSSPGSARGVARRGTCWSRQILGWRAPTRSAVALAKAARLHRRLRPHDRRLTHGVRTIGPAQRLASDPIGSLGGAEDFRRRGRASPPGLPESNNSTPGGEGPPARLLRFPAVRERTGLSRSTIWRLERRGDSPRHRRISPNAVAWVEGEVVQWIQSRIRLPGQ